MSPLRSLLFVVLGLASGAMAATSTGAPAAVAATVSAGMAPRVLACVVCHGREGRATNQGYFPRIAGKPEGYLYNQLPSAHHVQSVSGTPIWYGFLERH